jgi:hypothetical protein
MFWVAFKGYYGGKAISLGEIEQLEAEAYGMHGYPTQAEAEAKPNSVPAIAKAQVNAWIFNAQGSLTTHLLGQIPGPGDWLKGLTNWIGQQDIWVRGAEIVAGLMILYIGLKAVTAPQGASVRQIGGTTTKATVRHVRKVVTHT